MGEYINPEGSGLSKDEWCAKYGRPAADGAETDFDSKKEHMVILIDNGWMKALMIVYSKDEHEYVKEAKDERPKTYFLVDNEHLEHYSKNLQVWH